MAVSSTNRDLPSEENVSTAASQRGGAYRMNTQGGISLTREQTRDVPGAPAQRLRPTLAPPEAADAAPQFVAAADDPDVGDRLGPYFLQRLAGSGGMGRVFRAVHERLGRTVAIKIMYRACAVGDGPKRFLREARAVNKIHRKRPHPNVVEITDIHEAPEGQPSYYVMEWLEGYSLQERRVQCSGFLPIPELLTTMIAVTDAIEAAHQAGLVHRDLKPENIFLAESAPGTGRFTIKLIDFGVARDLAEPESAQADRLMGTVPYIAPEQVTGQSAGDERTDVYSLGVILFELCVGSLPFDGPDTDEALLRRVDHPAPRLREVAAPHVRARVPKELERIIERCLERNLAVRYPSMAALRKDLQMLLRQLEAPAWRRVLRPDLWLWRRGLHSAGVVAPGRAQATLRPVVPRSRRRVAKKVLAYLLMFGAIGALYVRRQALRVAIESEPALRTLFDPVFNRRDDRPEEKTLDLEVQVSSTPTGAEVYYGGQRLGVTPCVVRLPEGKGRTIELKRGGYRRAVRDIEVKLEARVNIRLEPLGRGSNSGSNVDREKAD